ncbi:MAG: Maf family protein [Acidobacteria bacterium]|nr:Maf family protein [Acidobacteriota bacterium]
MTRLILASGSPRRLELLRSIGIDPIVIPSRIEERLEPGESPGEYVTRLSEEKAVSVGRKQPDDWIVAADTIVVLEGEILEKPVSETDAAAMLSRLSGRTHTVLTAVTLHRQQVHTETTVTATDVKIAEMLRDEIAWYLSTGESMDKAGAYAAQGVGALFIEELTGSYSNVVGLPLARLYRMMKSVGIFPPEESK